MDQETRKSKSLSYGYLTEQEVIHLRLCYLRGESPSKIYEELYKTKLHYSSFLNIWDGHRYELIMPEVFDGKSHTKLNKEIVTQIREDYQQLRLSYKQLANKYHISKSTIADIITYRTWKNI